MSLLRKSRSKISSRRQIDIKSVIDGVLCLPDHEYRMILQTSSINFELKSEAEQDMLIDTYQSFLNSLNCPLQLLIRVREMDIDRYLEDFRQHIANESEDTYRKQIGNYTDFVGQLITSNKILARQFFIILSYTSPKDSREFEIVKEQLALQSDIVSKGLGRLGMSARTLSSLEVLDMFYSFYSPSKSKLQPLTNQTLELLKKVTI